MSKVYRPLRDKLIIKVFVGEEISKGGIVLTTERDKESMAREEGTVLAIGKACFYDTEPEDLKVGDKVAFARYAGKTLGKDENGFEIRTMRDIDILCIIEETK